MNNEVLSFEQALKNLETSGLSGQLYTNTKKVLTDFYANKAKQQAPINPPTAPKIKATDLTVNPIKIPEQQFSSTASTKLQGMNDAKFAELETQAKQQEALVGTAPTKESLLTRILQNQGILGTQAQRTNQIMEDQGVLSAKDEVQSISNEYRAKKLAYERQIADMEKQAGGYTSARNQEINRVSREANRDLTDLAIRADIADQQYSRAFDRATSLIDSEFAPIRAQIENDRVLLDLIKDDLSQKEELELRASLDEKARQTDFDYDLQLLKEKAKIDSVQNAEMSGVYTKSQLTALTKLNDTIAKDPTYAKTVGMKAYADTVVSALSNKNGISDIAAINQFQKIIDEGAVTRDQDVKLISSAQSLLGTLQTKIKGLQAGDKLSDAQRTQMRSMVEQFYSNQVKALNTSPFIAAKTKEAALYGLSSADTILSEFGGFGNTGGIDDPLGLGITPKKASSTASKQSGGGVSFGGKGLDPLSLFSLPGLTFQK